MPPRGYPSLVQSLHHDLQSPMFSSKEWSSSSKAPNPLVLMATGDLTQTASAKEFSQARRFLEDVVAAPLLGTQVSLKDVFVVPGNHDVVYNEPDTERRWSPYCEFYENITGQRVRPADADQLTRVVDRVDDLGLVVAEINSCVDVLKGTGDEIRGHVDPLAIERLRQQLERIAPERLVRAIRVALIHHHPVVLPALSEPGRGYDAVVGAQLLLATLQDFGFHLVLHGHKHYPHTFSYDAVCAWTSEPVQPMMVVAGGSASSRGVPEGVYGATNTYNLVAYKWNPLARQGRVRIVTRGLVRHDTHGALANPARWHWKTLRVDDRILTITASAPTVGRSTTRRYKKALDDTYDAARHGEYRRLRWNMLAAEVLPSLEPGLAYEVRVWLLSHDNQRRELPDKVVWSPGDDFDEVKTCFAKGNPLFSASFTYWGPMLVQARLYFGSEVVTSSIYARVPGLEGKWLSW